jgi:hypothetical protein
MAAAGQSRTPIMHPMHLLASNTSWPSASITPIRHHRPTT